MLGGFDHMEVEVKDREQVEVREKVEARETDEEDKTGKQQTLKHVMTFGWTCFYADMSCDSLSHNVMCAQGWKCRERVSCEVSLSARPVGYSGSLSTVTKPAVTKKQGNKIKWAHFQLHSDAYHHEELEDEGQYSHPVCWSTRALEQ